MQQDGEKEPCTAEGLHQRFESLYIEYHNPLFNNMKRLLKKLGKNKKSKNLSLATIDTLGSTSTSTIISTTDRMPFDSANGAIARLQVIQAAGVTVSVQINYSHS